METTACPQGAWSGTGGTSPVDKHGYADSGLGAGMGEALLFQETEGGREED